MDLIKEKSEALFKAVSRGTLLRLSLLGLVIWFQPSPANAQTSEQTVRYVKYGLSHFVRSEFDDAIVDFDRALDKQPDFGMAYFYRAKARQAKGDLEGALDDYEQALVADPTIMKVAGDIAGLYLARGKSRLEQLELDQAISDFDRAILLRPDQGENYFQRGLARLIDSDFTSAVSDFNKCIELDSKHAKAYLTRGIALMHQHNITEARRDFDKCRELKQQPDLMLQMYILEIETKIKERRAIRGLQHDRIASRIDYLRTENVL